MNLVNPVILVILVIPALLGFLVIGRMLWTGIQAAKTPKKKSLRKFENPVVPLLDTPFPCTSCGRLETVHVARADFREMPYVEHFVCHGCGTQYLGPNQTAMVEKRLEARKKFSAVLTGAAKNPETKS